MVAVLGSARMRRRRAAARGHGPGRTLARGLTRSCADLPATLRFQAQRQWRHRETKLLSGRRAVILGAGGIGRSIYRALNRAGLSVRCVARQPRNDGELGEIASLAELPRLLLGRISSFWRGH